MPLVEGVGAVACGTQKGARRQGERVSVSRRRVVWGVEGGGGTVTAAGGGP